MQYNSPTTITVFNRYENRQIGTYTWYPHVITGCNLIVDKAANIAKTGLENSDVAKLHIPYSNINGIFTIDGLIYLPPKEWDAQTNDAYSSTITFTDGEDFFMRGEYPEDPQDDDAHVGGLYAYLNKRYDDVYKITTVGMYRLIPHFEIGGA